MAYPPQQPGQWPQQPPQGYGPPPGYGPTPQQGPPAGYGPPVPQQGYGPPAPQGYGQPPGAPGGYGPPVPDWQRMYDEADASGAGLYTEGWWGAVITGSDYGLTKNQDKYAWTVVFTFTEGPDAGKQMTVTWAISPLKLDGTPNTGGTARLYKDMGKVGVPVGEKFGGAPGSAPFWQMGWTGEQVAAHMVQAAVPVQIHVQTDHEWGNSKIKGIRPVRQGAPQPGMAAPQQAPPQPGMAPQGGYAPPQAAPQPGPAAPVYSYGNPPQTGPQPVPQGYQPPYGPAAPQPGAQVPGPQPGPGQGGMGQFTAEGQGWQPGMPPPQQGMPPQAPPQAAPQGPPAAAPYPQAPPNGAPMQPGPQPGQQAPPQMPWRQ